MNYLYSNAVGILYCNESVVRHTIDFISHGGIELTRLQLWGQTAYFCDYGWGPRLELGLQSYWHSYNSGWEHFAYQWLYD